MAPISELKEVTMARPYLPSFFGRGDDPFVVENVDEKAGTAAA